ncbi:MAG: metallophosphoesterase family protein [Verrucomicrobia bacterium]|nr:metallophosphoesterase family protein [Verrucomicrobiota bacterium]
MNLRLLSRLIPCLLLLALLPALPAHVGPHPSVHDTVAGITQRLKKEMPVTQLTNLTAARVEAFLTAPERQILGEESVTFHVNVPVSVAVLRDVGLGNEPFWLGERGFQTNGLRLKAGSVQFDAWEKNFPAGDVGLGINSLRGGGEHYFVLLRPQQADRRLVVDELYPGKLRLAELRPGVKPFTDRDDTITNVPPALVGQVLLRTERARRNDAKLLNLFRWTPFPSSPRPDHVVLTWSGNPKTTQALQWRTSPETKTGAVAYAKKVGSLPLVPMMLREVKATPPTRLTDKFLLNDPVVHRFKVELMGLEAGTTYLYRVGDGSPEGWTEFAEFTTAPAGIVPFSFSYMGDAQNGLETWGRLLHNAFHARPDAAFYVMAGDLVNRGAERDDWDSFFQSATGVFDRRQLVPVLGNHECQGGRPAFYLQQFALPKNGPPGLEPERVYAFEYSNALLVVLDSNLDPKKQTTWLESLLARSRATWKLVSYHHPAYSSAPNRDNKTLRRTWTPLFDKYHVDLALQGHDHAYLRTHPMKGNRPVATTKEGTVYIVSVSGTKFYSQAQRDYTVVGLTNVATYQVLDLQIHGNRLNYRAYDLDGKVRDEFVIEK